jgi:5,10-methylenetetrahydromethanopterin reductase
MKMPGTGVVLQGVDPPPVFVNTVARIEELGLDHLWLTDSSLHARNPYAYLTLAAMRSHRLTLGTAVTNPVTRHPALTAVAIATVDEISGGRMILGLGAGDRPLEALGERPATVQALRASVEAIRQLLAGKSVDGSVLHWRFVDAHLRFTARADLPLFISASGPKALTLAGEIADGVILLVGLFPDAIRLALGHIDEGARRARRSRPHVAVFAYGSISDDTDRALEDARSIAAWFPQTVPMYARLAGLPEELVGAVQAAYRGGEFQEARRAAEVLPAEFIRAMALAGNAKEARRHISNLLELGVDSVHVFPLGEDRLGTIEAFARCWKEVAGTR